MASNIYRRGADIGMISQSEVSEDWLCRKTILDRSDGECFVAHKTYLTKASLLDGADAVRGVLSESRICGHHHTGLYVSGLTVGAEILVEIEARLVPSYPGDDDEDNPPKDSDPLKVEINVTGPRTAHALVFSILDKVFGSEKFAAVEWWYHGTQGPATRTIFLDAQSTQLRPEFYPDLGGPQEFLKDYLSSEASILMLAGPPGTGKTTLLRHLICDHCLTAHIVYDESLMGKDKIFQTFLMGPDDLMIIEDADALLTSREIANNRLMAMFLNVSDGLIKLPNKKLVFTTNITDFGRVDAALTRPGRCFGVVHTRPLNLSEAQVAARMAGLPVPIERGEYTLAELFNKNKPQARLRKVGF